VDYSYSYYAINPRSETDMISGANTVTLAIPHQSVGLHSSVSVPINAYRIETAQNYQSYSFSISFNPHILNYESINTAGTLSQAGNVIASAESGVLSVSYQSNSSLSGQGILLKLNFYAANTGTTALTFSDVIFGADVIQSCINGSVTVNSSYNSPGDTLTVIQRPLLNIPEIVVPGETLKITCLAPQNTSNWNAWLRHNNKRLNLPVTNSQWLTLPNRWELTTTVPSVPVYELYDLEVSASGGISDITANAVQVIPSRKKQLLFCPYNRFAYAQSSVLS